VVSDQKRKKVHIVDENTKLLHKSLSIKEVVGGDQKIPRKRSKPRQIVHLVHSITNVDNLRKTLKYGDAADDHSSRK
jgi:hypothetical protein